MNKNFLQFNKRIKILRYDNVLEYMQSIMNSFYAYRGIIRQTSYAHTSQQNDIVE